MNALLELAFLSAMETILLCCIVASMQPFNIICWWLIGPAETKEERSCIQLDLDRLSSWSSTWALQFNATKCKVLHLGHSNPHHPYHIGCDQLEAVAKKRALSVIVDKDIKFHSHIQAQVAKANQALRLIKCSFVTRKSCVVTKLYKSLVCPHLEFGLSPK